MIVVLGYLWMSGILPKMMIPKNPSENVTYGLSINHSLKSFPPEIRDEIHSLAGNYSLALENWGFDPINNEIDLYEYAIHNESAIIDLQGKQIDDYTIQIMNYSDILQARDEVGNQLTQIQNKPEYQIAHISMIEDTLSIPRKYYAELAVYRSTNENKNLDNMVIKGWKIQVGVIKPYSESPIPNNTGNYSKSR